MITEGLEYLECPIGDTVPDAFRQSRPGTAAEIPYLRLRVDSARLVGRPRRKKTGGRMWDFMGFHGVYW